MSTSVSSVVSHFPSPQDGFTTTTSGSVSSGASSVGLNSVAGYSNGQIAAFVIDPTDATKKQTFTGVVDTSGIQITDVIWTAGTNVAHSSGATVVDYATATHIAMMTKGILVEHDQDGGHNDITADTLTVATSTTLPAGDIATADIANNAVNYLKVAAGAIVQVVNVTYSAVSTGTTTMPQDDTVPTSSEGNQFMTLSITPKSATNILVIEVQTFLANSVASTLQTALYQDSGAALAVSASAPVLADRTYTIPLRYTMAAGTTSSTTFTVRAGSTSAGTVTFNGVSAGRLYGSAIKSSIVIYEYKA